MEKLKFVLVVLGIVGTGVLIFLGKISGDSWMPLITGLMTGLGITIRSFKILLPLLFIPAVSGCSLLSSSEFNEVATIAKECSKAYIKATVCGKIDHPDMRKICIDIIDAGGDQMWGKLTDVFEIGDAGKCIPSD